MRTSSGILKIKKADIMQTLILANGQLHTSNSLLQIAQSSELIIAADGGSTHCKKLKCTPHYVIGDLDSIPADLLTSFTDTGVEVLQFPVRKDATDLELAMDFAIEKQADSISLAGLLGGRWDMSFSNIFLLAQKKYRHVKTTIHDEKCVMHILHPGKHVFQTGIKQRVSILPLQGDVENVTLRGFEYPLEQFTIAFGSTIGVSNVTSEPQVEIQHTDGVLLLIFSL